MSSVPIPQGSTIASAPAQASTPASVPIPANAVVETEPGKGPTLTPQETLASDNMGALSGMTGMPAPSMSKQEKEDFEAGKKAGTISGARDAATMAVAGPVLSKAAEVLTATKPVVQTVGTGILDSAGKEIMKDVVSEGPSLISKLGPKALKLAIGGGASALGLKWLTKLAGGLGLGVAANAAYDRLKGGGE